MRNTTLRSVPFHIMAVVFAAALGACSPPTSTDTPDLKGQVVDGATGRPVFNARVSMDYDGNYQEVGSDTDGSFWVQATQVVNVPLVTPKNTHHGGTLKIEAPGYQTYTESGLGARGVLPGVGPRAPGSMAAGRTGPDFDHVRIALVPNT